MVKTKKNKKTKAKKMPGMMQRQRVPVQQAKPATRSAPRQQQRQLQQQYVAEPSYAPQVQQLNSQQLAAVVGPDEAACMSQPFTQTVFQKKIAVRQVPITYTMMYETMAPVTITTTPQVEMFQQPMSQVQLTTCQSAPRMMSAPCPEEPSCQSGSCFKGPYESASYASQLQHPGYYPQHGYPGYYPQHGYYPNHYPTLP